MSPAGIIYWSDVLLYIMQGSILVPMAVAWVYRQRFSPPVRLLTWYVYWSLACSAGARLATLNHLSNYGFIAAFNTGKLLLFGLVYYRVLAHRAWRRWVAGFTLITSAGILVVALSDLYLAMVVARVAQCTLLAGFAMAYLEQFATDPQSSAAFKAPLVVLSVGQLLYSAGTVTAFSFSYWAPTVLDLSIKFLIVSVFGLVFNAFLTLAFLVDRAPPVATGAAN